MKPDTEKFDWGIYNGIGIRYDFRDKERNVQRQARYMINRSINMFKYHNLPDTIPEKELEKLLQINGFAGVTEVKGDLYAFFGGLGGEPDVYRRPTMFTVSNPALRYSKNHEIGKDIVLIKNDEMLQGLVPIYSKHLTLINETEMTMMLTLIKHRAGNILSVTDDNTAESAKRYLEKLEQGEVGYIFENKLYDSLKTNPANDSNGLRLNELIEFEQYFKAQMFNEIGLNANFNMKRERLISDEIELNSESLYPLIDDMLHQRRLGLEQVNEMYGTDIQVEFNSSWDYRVGREDLTEVENPERDEQIDLDNEIEGLSTDTEKTTEDVTVVAQGIDSETESQEQSEDLEDVEDTENSTDELDNLVVEDNEPEIEEEETEQSTDITINVDVSTNEKEEIIDEQSGDTDLESDKTETDKTEDDTDKAEADKTEDEISETETEEVHSMVDIDIQVDTGNQDEEIEEEVIIEEDTEIEQDTDDEEEEEEDL